MANDAFWIKQGDRLKTLVRVLKNADGSVINLTGAAARFRMRRLDYGTTRVDAVASVSDPTAGEVTYAWAAGDTDVAGDYEGEFEITFSSGKVLSVPTDGYIPIHVVRDVS